jgi:hypothetical protein
VIVSLSLEHDTLSTAKAVLGGKVSLLYVIIQFSAKNVAVPLVYGNLASLKYRSISNFYIASVRTNIYRIA